MDENGLARALGWLSVGVGVVVVAVPGPVMKAIGLGDRPNLGRLLGVRDLVLGTGLLLSQNTASWCRARGIADALDVALRIAVLVVSEGRQWALSATLIPKAPKRSAISQ